MLNIIQIKNIHSFYLDIFLTFKHYLKQLKPFTFQ